MATLETSPEANCDRQADRQAGGQDDKATYRGSSYRSAPKQKLSMQVKDRGIDQSYRKEVQGSGEAHM